MATVIIEFENRLRMMSSSCFLLRFLLLAALLQWIVFNAHKVRSIVECGRVRTLALSKGGVGHALSPHQPW
jgi:hypothetical protein